MNSHFSQHPPHIAQLDSFAVVKASGAGILTYLQGQITQDTGLLSPDQALYAAILTPQAKAVTDFYLLQAEEDAVIFICPTNFCTAFIDRLRRFSLGYELRMGMLSKWQVISIQGQATHAFLQEQQLPCPAATHLAVTPNHADTYVIHMPEGSEHGVWVVSANIDLASNCDAAAMDKLRTIQGVPRFGIDWTSSVFPLNANLIERQGVSFDKGCYVGQEVTSRMHWRKGIKKKLYQVWLETSVSLPCPIFTTAKVGEMTSLAATDNGYIGIALLPIALVDDGQNFHTEDGIAIKVLSACTA